MIKKTHAFLSALGCFLFLASSAHAQEPLLTNAVSVIAGAAQVDLDGTYSSALLGARATMELNRWLLGEAGITAMRNTYKYELRPTYIFPELQLQAQLPFRVVRPYIGAGAGFATGFGRGYRSATKPTLSAAGGVRALIPGTSTTLQAELRLRGIDTGGSSGMAEWTFGVGRRF